MSSTASLVTGGAGFIGSHLAEALLARGPVRVLDDLSPLYPGKEANIARLRGREGFEFVRGDILDPAVMRRALADVDVVFHLAAQPGARLSVREPEVTRRLNVEGTVAVLDACRGPGVSMFVNASSSSVYGAFEGRALAEGLPLRPVSPYGASKAAAEAYCHAYHAAYGLPVVSLRYFTAYGPRQRPDMAIHRFALAVLEGGRPQVFGDGRQTRDYTYVDDIVSGTVAASRRGRPGEVYNLGSGRRTDVLALLRLLGKACGRTVEPELLPARAGDVQDTLADVSRARTELGWAPSISLDEGVRRFVEWLRAR